eukprot:m.219109 g.219109  ORF g.219109 m.219109 type:complete len:53 (+) comp26278_c0_seq4:304-462(+)
MNCLYVLMYVCMYASRREQEEGLLAVHFLLFDEATKKILFYSIYVFKANQST